MQRSACLPGLFAVALLVLGAGTIEWLMPRHCDAGTHPPTANRPLASDCSGSAAMEERFREP